MCFVDELIRHVSRERHEPSKEVRSLAREDGRSLWEIGSASDDERQGGKDGNQVHATAEARHEDGGADE